MASSLFTQHCNFRSCLGRDNSNDYNKPKNPIIKVNGHHSTMFKKLGVATQQIEPRKKQSVDPYRQGMITDGGVGYRQTVVIRSYEVGPDKFLEDNQLWSITIEYRRECGSSDVVESLCQLRGRTSWRRKSSPISFSM